MAMHERMFHLPPCETAERRGEARREARTAPGQVPPASRRIVMSVQTETKQAEVATTRGPILVVGSTGKTGKRVAPRLSAMDIAVRHGSRRAVPPFDWNAPSMWPAAVQGVRAVYLTYHPDLAVPGADELVGAFARACAEAGVRRIVLLSGRGEKRAQIAEEAVRAAGVPLTVLRASWFCQNFSEGHLHAPTLEGCVAFPAGDVAEPFIDIEDIADAVVVALTRDGHEGKTYELTGPRLLTFAEAAGEIARATGRDVRYLPISSKDYGAVLAQYVPPEEAAFLEELFAELLDGHNAHVSDGVERILGRGARDFRAFAESAAKSGVWTP
jgi:uncharacterized protein YbjT (DUF2867 family)